MPNRFVITDTHRYEQYTPKQCPSECSLDNFFIAFAGNAVSLQQRCDVERQLCDGAESRIHHCSQCKVTLCRNAEGECTDSNKNI